MSWRNRAAGLAAAGLLAAGLLVTGSGGARAATTQLCQSQTAAVGGGVYTVQNNEWGSSAPECITTDGNADFTVANSSISNATNGAPGGYPSIYQGCHWGNCTSGGLSGNPVQASAITTGKVTTSWSTTQPGGSNDYDVAYDIWSKDSGQPALRQPSDGPEGKFLHADADPLRVFGPAFETHPEEFQEAMTRLGEAGVEVDLRPGSMSYSPAAVGGRPGRLILDPEASYGAVLHEMSHFSDDELAGFPGLRYWLEDPTVTANGESRAYQAEIDYANSIGEPGIADQLEELKAQRIGQLIGENDE